MHVLDTLEVAIGIFFVWFLVSMLVSACQEMIASQLKWRAKDLEKAIHHMLESPTVQKRLEIPVGDPSSGKSGLKWLRRLFRGRGPALEPANQLARSGWELVSDTGMPMSSATAHTSMNQEMLSGSGTANLPNASERLPAQAKLSGERFYKHPLIHHLSFASETHGPSYIPASYFADVIFDLIIQAGGPESRIRKAAEHAENIRKRLEEMTVKPDDKEFTAVLEQLKETLSAVNSWSDVEDYSDEVVANINRLAPKLIRKNPALASAIRQLQLALESRPLRGQLSAGVAAIARDNPYLGQTLNALITRAIENAKTTDEAIATARQNVERWFDTAMERLSGHYKRNAQVVTIVVGLVIALFTNIDSLSIARSLWYNPTMRAAVLAGIDSPIAQPDESKTPQQYLADLNTLQIPFGWSYIADNELCKSYIGPSYTRVHCIYPSGFDPKNTWDRRSATLSFLGILLTALAVLPGAPFWFQMASKLVNLRGSGAVPSSSTDRIDKAK